jgi:hypothetical protein
VRTRAGRSADGQQLAPEPSDGNVYLRLRGADPAFHLALGGVAQTRQSARLSGERPPVRVRSSPLRGGRGVDGSTRGCEPRRRRFEPGRPPSPHADAEQLVSSPRCKRGASCCGGSTPSVRITPPLIGRGMKLWWQSASLATRRSGFDSRRLHLRLRSVNGKHAPVVRSRCGFDSCRRLRIFLRP